MQVTLTTKPYLMDLESTNGSFINDVRCDPRRYYELLEQDTLRFGNSTRKVCVRHANNKKSTSETPQGRRHRLRLTAAPAPQFVLLHSDSKGGSSDED
eukprot:SAG31_NODE_3093_length_4682_cov_47.973816_2_plen_98_part_00